MGDVMRFPIIAFSAAFLSIAGPATAAGIRLIDVPAGPIRGIVWSPCDAPAGEVRLRDSVFSGTKDCPIPPGKRPLIVISHGRTGWSGGHHDTAAALADAGFIVAAIDHPIDSGRSKTSRIEDIAYLAERPADIKHLIDFMLDASGFAANIDPARVGFFGFSRGGYTGLALVGGRPNDELARAACAGPPTSAPVSGPSTPGNLCEQIRARGLPHGYVTDPRIKAAVLADPAPAFLFGREDLKSVSVPLQLWASEQGGRGASAEATTKIADALPSKTNVNIVRGAAHFVFLAPCSAEAAKSEPEFCADGASFDRTAFHKQFNASLVAFFRQQLGQRPGD
jgi:predicted dienelactone hydrolase